MQCFQFPKSHESSETMINFLLNEVGPSCQIASYSFKTTLKFYFLVVKFSSSSITDFPVAQTVKNLPATQETRVQSLGWEVSLEKGMAVHSSILVWRIPWTEKSGGLQSMLSQRVGHN